MSFVKSFVYDGRARLGPLKAKHHRWRRTVWSDGTGRKSNPTNETIRASAEKDAGMFTTDGNCVIKMAYSDEEISAVLAESRQARKHIYAEVGQGN